MPTDTAREPASAAKFAVRAAAWSVGFFVLLRSGWVESRGVLPYTRLQEGLAAGWFGAPVLPINVTAACSGADALALSLGAILAYPVSWRTRLAGAAGGAALIFCLNVLRIGTLGQAAATPAWFNTLHVYVWPAVLALAISAYVFAWMRLADRTSRTAVSVDPPQPSRRFVLLTALFLLLFSVATPFYLESASVLALAGFIARAAAAILGVAGVSANAIANVLWAPRGGFVVTQECISTPLIPVYLAAVCAYSTSWRRMALGVLATLPLFTALGIARLLVVALPVELIASPAFVVHAFYQLLLGAVVVFLAAVWRHGRKAALGYALMGGLAGVLFAYLLGPVYTRAVTYLTGAQPDDPQGAIAILPAFQVSLYVALWIAAFIAVGWTRFVAGLAILGLTQTTALLALPALATYSGMTARVSDVRGWAVAGPLLISIAVINVARTRRRT